MAMDNEIFPRTRALLLTNFSLSFQGGGYIMILRIFPLQSLISLGAQSHVTWTPLRS